MKKKERETKKKDFCSYCETLVLDFARYVKRNHSMEMDVQKIRALSPGKKERKNLLAALRKKGNFLNMNSNKKLLKIHQSEMN